jgi:tRNA nucleotidyltransferase/poly(A) polymerase
MNEPVYRELFLLSKELKSKVYIVGGILRDYLTGMVDKNADMDFTSDMALKLARKFSRRTGGSFVMLDQEEETGRVVIKKEKNTDLIMDFSQTRGNNIIDDIYKRDFTINSIAMSFNDFFSSNTATFIDPSGGMNDIKNKVIRVVSGESLSDDPLRMIRAFRFAAKLNFDISPDTIKLIESHKEKIITVSRERIETELFKMLDSDRSCKYVKEMYDSGLLLTVIPEVKNIKWEIYGKLEKILSGEFINMFPEFSEEIKNYMTVPSRKSMIKFGLLLQGEYNLIGDLCRNLKMSNYKTDTVTRLVTYYRDILQEKNRNNKIFILNFFRKTGDDGIAILLTALSDGIASKEEVDHILKVYYNNIKPLWESPRLIKGHDLIELFNLKPGPDFKKILYKIEEQQVQGIIKTREEALKFVREYYS